jgi:chromosome partitioning protein
MARTIALANPGGGSGKTSSAIGIASMLVDLGQQVLAVDLDAQAGLTRALGVDPETLSPSLFDVLVRGTAVTEAMIDTDAGLDLLPSTLDLSAAEAGLVTRAGRELLLRTLLEPVAADYDWIVIDAASSMGLLTVNALSLADLVVVPMRGFSARAVGQVLDTTEEIRRFVNPGVVLLGALPVGHDAATAETLRSALALAFGERLPVLDPIPEPPRALNAYRELVKELLRQARN